jgi:hypothetical protein
MTQTLALLFSNRSLRLCSFFFLTFFLILDNYLHSSSSVSFPYHVHFFPSSKTSFQIFSISKISTWFFFYFLFFFWELLSFHLSYVLMEDKSISILWLLSELESGCFLFSDENWSHITSNLSMDWSWIVS